MRGSPKIVVDDKIKNTILANTALSSFLESGEFIQGKEREVLGVPATAGVEEIETAYKQIKSVVATEKGQFPSHLAAKFLEIKDSAIAATEILVRPQQAQEVQSAFQNRNPPPVSSPTSPSKSNDGGEQVSSSPLRKKVEVPLRKFDALLAYIDTGDDSQLKAMSPRKQLELNKEHSLSNVVGAREAAFKVLFGMLEDKGLTDTKRDHVITAIYTVEEASGDLRKKLLEPLKTIDREHKVVDDFLREKFPNASHFKVEHQKGVSSTVVPDQSLPASVPGSPKKKKKELHNSEQATKSPLSPAPTTISKEDLQKALGGYKSSAAITWFSSPGPEYKALQDLVNKDVNKKTFTLDEIKTVVSEASKKIGGKSYRADLLTNPNGKPEDKTGVSAVIKAIGEKLKAPEAANTLKR